MIINAPKEYGEVIQDFEAEVLKEIGLERIHSYKQVFGTSNEEIQTYVKKYSQRLWKKTANYGCYPKNPSKIYKRSNCSRDTVDAFTS